MAKSNLTKDANISASVRELDFVSRFSANWNALLDIMGIARPIRKELGAALKVKKGAVTLQASNVGEGEEIPYSLASVTEETIGEATLDKWAKAVSIEAIKTHGYDVAVAKTDDAFLTELQKVVMNRFYTFLNTGTLTNVETTFQKALAMARGHVINKFEQLGKTATEVVGFANILDVYDYLGGANVTIQTQFGFNYIRDFMGYRVIFLLDASKIARNTVIATPVENIVMYYVDPSDSGFANAGLVYTVDGVTPLLGFHTQGNYTTAVSENFAIMGLFLFAEYLDAIAVVEVEASGSLGSITVASSAGTTKGSKVTVTYTLGQGETAYYKDAAAAATPTYLDEVDLTGWAKLTYTSGTAIDNWEGLTAGQKLTVIAVNGSGQAVASGNATIVNHA